MKFLLIPVLIVLMGLTLYSLLRGLNAFRQGIGDDAAAAKSGPTELQLKQNQMMIKRIMYQAGAIVVVFLLLLAYR